MAVEADTVIINIDDTDEIVELAALLPFPNDNGPSPVGKKLKSPRPQTRAEFSVRHSLEASVLEARQRDRMLRQPIVPSKPKPTGRPGNRKVYISIPFVSAQQNADQYRSQMKPEVSLPVVIDTFLGNSSPKSPKKIRKLRRSVDGRPETPLKSFAANALTLSEEPEKRTLNHKDINSPLFKIKKKRKKPRHLKDVSNGNERLAENLIEVYSAITSSVLSAFLKLLVQVFTFQRYRYISIIFILI